MAQMALVTGASSGFGAEFARQLAARGCGVILSARRQERLAALADEIRAAHDVAVETIPLDLGARGGPQALFDEVAGRGLQVDVLINNAGFGQHGRFLEIPIERQQEMIDLDVSALTQLTWLCARPMLERRHGLILLVSSIAAAQPSPSYAAYAACKVYVEYLGAALNHELKGTGVSVTVTAPGPSPTEFGKVADQGRSIMHRMGELPPAEIVRCSLDALFARKARTVPGWTNALLTTVSGLTPWPIAMRTAETLISDK